MQVARTNRWSALGSVGGLIASGIGANWAAMAISAAAAGPIILTLIAGLLVGGLILLALSGPGRPRGTISWRGQVVVGTITEVAVFGIPSIPPAWRDAVAVISTIVPALAAHGRRTAARVAALPEGAAQGVGDAARPDSAGVGCDHQALHLPLTFNQTLRGQRATIGKGQVSDEKSSIQRLRQLLSDRHLTYQEIQPRFLQELQQSRNEIVPELRLLL